MPPLLAAAAYWLGLASLSAALGRRLLRALRMGPSDPAERAVVGTILGLGALQFVPFVVFALGVGRPSVLRLVVLAVGVLLLPDVVGAARFGLRLLCAMSAMPVWGGAVVGILAGGAALVFVRAQGPTVDGDALAYHLVAPLRWLAAGGYQIVPSIPYANWPMSTEALAAPLLAFDRCAPVGLIQFTFGILATWGAYLLGRRLHGSAAGVVSVLLLLVYRRYSSQFVTLHVELATTAYLTAAALALTSIRQGAAGWRRAPELAAAFAGLTATAKLNGLWMIPLIAGITWPLGDLAAGQRRARCVGQLAIGVAIVAPWLVRCWALTGNPVCPMLFSVFGGRGWTAEGAHRFYEGHRLFCVLPALGTSSSAIARQHVGLAVLGVLLLAVAFLKTRRSTQAEPARLAAGLAASLAISGYINSRFFMPALPCVAVCLSGWARGRERRIAAWAAPIAALLAVYTVAQLLPPNVAQAWAYGTGRLDRDRWYTDYMPEYPAIRYANEHLPASSGVLVAAYEKRVALFQCRGFWSDALLQDDIHYDTPAHFEADLRRLGITHLFIVDDYRPDCSRNLYCDARQRAEVAMQEDLATRRGTLLFQQNNARLYALRWE